MEYSIGELVDRLTILELKKERQIDWTDAGQLTEFQEAVKDYINRHGPIDQEFFHELKEVNGKVWDLESDIRLGKEGLLGYEEVGRRALLIRDLNDRRTHLKDAMNKRYNYNAVEKKHTNNLRNVIPPLTNDLSWFANLYNRIDSEISRAKSTFDTNLNWGILISIPILGAVFTGKVDPGPVLVLGCVSTAAFFSRAVRAYNSLINHSRARDLIDDLKLDHYKGSIQDIRCVITEIRQRLYSVEGKHSTALPWHELFKRTGWPEFIILFCIYCGTLVFQLISPGERAVDTLSLCGSFVISIVIVVTSVFGKLRRR